MLNSNLMPALILVAIGLFVALFGAVKERRSARRLPIAMDAEHTVRKPEGKPKYNWNAILVAGWQIGAVATTVFLMFFDGYNYTWSNWIIAVPVNFFLGEIWPIYWFILRPLMG